MTMISRAGVIWLLAGGLLAAGCSDAKNADVDTQLRAAFQERYIEPYVAGETDRWLEVFAADAVALHNGLPPLEGRDAIRGFAEAVAANFAIRRLDAQVDDVQRHGDWAWTRGTFVADFEAIVPTAPPGVAGLRHGKFLLLWERQPNGDWLVVMDMGNDMPAPPAADPPPGSETAAAAYYPCVACHGADGAGNEALGAPAIAGLDAAYIALQLRHFRDGVRGAALADLDGRQMSLVAAVYTDDAELDRLARHVAALPDTRPRRTIPAGDADGATLYATCIACHGSRGEGNPALGAPALAVLDDWYILRQLRLFADGLRGAQPGDRGGAQMRAALVAAGIGADQHESLAAHIVSLAEGS